MWTQLTRVSSYKVPHAHDVGIHSSHASCADGRVGGESRHALALPFPSVPRRRAARTGAAASRWGRRLCLLQAPRGYQGLAVAIFILDSVCPERCVGMIEIAHGGDTPLKHLASSLPIPQNGLTHCILFNLLHLGVFTERTHAACRHTGFKVAVVVLHGICGLHAHTSVHRGDLSRMPGAPAGPLRRHRLADVKASERIRVCCPVPGGATAIDGDGGGLEPRPNVRRVARGRCSAGRCIRWTGCSARYVRWRFYRRCFARSGPHGGNGNATVSQVGGFGSTKKRPDVHGTLLDKLLVRIRISPLHRGRGCMLRCIRRRRR
eukprot:m.739803 g.739803  ORF g.739803 m.739803 type:complete len:320 (+) comp23110_c0_seq5:3126-4085(+)